MAAPGLISGHGTTVDDDLDSIEVLSAQYRPTASVHHVYNNNHGATSGLPGDPIADTDQLLQPHHHRNLDAIRSVDDYEKENTFFFRPSPSPAKPRDSSSFNHRHGLQAARSRSQSGGRATAVDNALVGVKSTLVAVPMYNGDMVLLDTAACDATDTAKEALSPEERKRKRITLAVGIIAGLIIIASILLVAITLNMTSRIDAIVKEQNDNIYDKLTANNDHGLWKNSSSSAQNYPILQYANRDSK